MCSKILASKSKYQQGNLYASFSQVGERRYYSDTSTPDRESNEYGSSVESLEIFDRSIGNVNGRNGNCEKLELNRENYLSTLLNKLEKNNNNKFYGITRLISNPEFLKFAYYQIKNKLGNLTFGGSIQTPSGISNNWFETAAEKLRLGTYIFGVNRKIEISKKKGKWPLVVSSPKDKIVQKALEIVLEYIYETKLNYFSAHSHGFRKNKSAHTALKEIKMA